VLRAADALSTTTGRDKGASGACECARVSIDDADGCLVKRFAAESDPLAAERRKYWGSESMGWNEEGAGGRGGYLLPRWSGTSTPGKFVKNVGQNPAFWFILRKKMCFSLVRQDRC